MDLTKADPELLSVPPRAPDGDQRCAGSVRSDAPSGRAHSTVEALVAILEAQTTAMERLSAGEIEAAIGMAASRSETIDRLAAGVRDRNWPVPDGLVLRIRNEAKRGAGLLDRFRLTRAALRLELRQSHCAGHLAQSLAPRPRRAGSRIHLCG